MADFWFGNLTAAGYFPAPTTGMDASAVGDTEITGFLNGGAYVSQSDGTHREFDFAWPMNEKSIMQRLVDYRNGVYGTGLLYMVDPFASNAMPPHWATPGLTCKGWPSLVAPGNKPTIAPAATVTNWATNPRFTTPAGFVNVRTNLYAGERSINGASAGAALTTGISYAGVTWDRFAQGTSTGQLLRFFAPQAALVNGATYTVQMEVANDGATAVASFLDWCDSGNGGGTIQPGERRIISVTGSRATYDAIYRFSDLSLGANQSLLFRNVMIEETGTVKPYFNGSTPASGDFSYTWFGAANTSISYQRAVGVATASINTVQTLGYMITDPTSLSGTAFRSVLVATGNMGINVIVPNTGLGSTLYTVLMRVRASRTMVVRPRIFINQTTQGNVTLPANEWVTIRASVQAVSDNVYTGLLISSGSGHQIGDTIDMDYLLVTPGDYTGPYFDGSTRFLDGSKGAWSGAADASTSSIARTPGNMPNFGALYTLSGTPGTVPQRKLTLLVPSDRDLWLGFSGSSTNGGTIRMQTITRDGAYGLVRDLVLLDPAGSTRLNTVVSGGQYRAVQIYMTPTLIGAATINLVSSKAVYTETGATPVLTGDHVTGDGHTGFRISDVAMSYIQAANGHQYVTAATKATEMEAWL